MHLYANSTGQNATCKEKWMLSVLNVQFCYIVYCLKGKHCLLLSNFIFHLLVTMEEIENLEYITFAGSLFINVRVFSSNRGFCLFVCLLFMFVTCLALLHSL